MNKKHLFPKHWDSKLKTKWYRYSTRIAKRELPITLTFTEFEELLNSNCVYCGDTENNTIDRIDSSKGYTTENCQTLCLSCNVLKRAYDETKFLEKITKIYEYRKSL